MMLMEISMMENGKMVNVMAMVIIPITHIGKLKCANGDEYEGEWKDDKRNGQGNYLFEKRVK